MLSLHVCLFLFGYVAIILLYMIYVDPNTTLHEDETISHKKRTINAIQCIFGKFGLHVVPHPWKPYRLCPNTQKA